MNKLTPILLTGVVALGVAGCDVDVEQEGKLPTVDVDFDPGQLPKYEVRKVQEGKLPTVDVDVQSGQMPEVEVRGPEVEIEKKTVEVPVPDVDVNAPKESDG